jgi:hypothetical protein
MSGGVALTAMIAGLTSAGAVRVTVCAQAALARKQRPTRARVVQRFMVLIQRL